MNKVCSTCKEVKNYSEFNKHRGNPDGHQYSCRVCTKRDANERYHAEPGTQMEYNERWREKKPFYTTWLGADLRARRYNVESVTYEEFRDKMLSFPQRCMNPHCESGACLSVDHIVPFSKGGSNTLDNLQMLCKSCNCKKATKVIDYTMTVEIDGVAV